jgi:hypothetical protein
MSLSCGRCNAPTLLHLGQVDHHADNTLLSTADRYLCLFYGAADTYYVYSDGAVVLTDCLDARGHG